VWIDKERFVPLKEELFAKSGELLKRTTFRIYRLKCMGKKMLKIYCILIKSRCIEITGGIYLLTTVLPGEI